ncbi:MAG: NUDIX domain-containing protein [Glutamicibacter sp.]|uniref:NUDIX hydrolase n=1 Tax=Glutamicibacter sp. TaxID=1931995 RepID=UPI002FC99AAD
MKKNLTISAACLINNQGEILLVRKRGTTKFMQPGGKPEAGETALQTIIREIREELGLSFTADELRYDGEWIGPAANEADTMIRASLYSAAFDGELAPLAELEELLWIDPQVALERDDLAPLLRDRVLPLAIERSKK